MKIVQINTFSYKATGSIMLSLHKVFQEHDFDSYIIWGRGQKQQNKHEISIENKVELLLHGLYTRITDKTGFSSNRATNNLLKKLNEINPDIIHLHNIHGYYLNIEMLFNYIRCNKIKVIWTLHDCWAFTGHCAYFDSVDCQKWKRGCHNCEQLKTYPASKILDNSRWNWEKKKELFSGLDITLVTPSKWLADLTKESFLWSYPLYIIHNGLDLNTFKYLKSNFRTKNKLENKIIILGVASEWTKRKGLDDFIKLAGLLDDRFQIILVGLKSKQIKKLPNMIIGIKRTENIRELVELYSTCNIYFNPTYEDNYPTTNLEAVACGTPVVTYRTGGSPESVFENYGVVLEQGEVETFAKHLIASHFTYSENKLDRNVLTYKIDKSIMMERYLQLYRNVYERKYTQNENFHNHSLF